CALGIATPAAIMIGAAKGAQAGILVKSGEVLEKARAVSLVVFDKTGTLTSGSPSVTDVEAIAPFDKGTVARLAASGVEFAALEGRATALETAGKTVMLVAIDGKAAGLIAVADTLKESAAEAV